MLSAGVGVLLFLPVHLQLANCSLSAFHVIIGALKEQELRLVTNLTKLRSGRSMTQQGLAFWLEAISCRVGPQATVRVTREDGGWSQRLLRSQPPTIETRGWKDTGTIIQDPLKCDWCHSFWVLWLHVVPVAARGWLPETVGWDTQTHSRLPEIHTQTLTSQWNLFYCQIFSSLSHTNGWSQSMPIPYLIWQLVKVANESKSTKLLWAGKYFV